MVERRGFPQSCKGSSLATSALVDRAPPHFFTDSFQRGLARWNRTRLVPAFSDQNWRGTRAPPPPRPAFPDESWPAPEAHGARMRRHEGAFLDALRAEVSAEAADVPT